MATQLRAPMKHLSPLCSKGAQIKALLKPPIHYGNMVPRGLKATDSIGLTFCQESKSKKKISNGRRYIFQCGTHTRCIFDPLIQHPVEWTSNGMPAQNAAYILKPLVPHPLFNPFIHGATRCWLGCTIPFLLPWNCSIHPLSFPPSRARQLGAIITINDLQIKKKFIIEATHKWLANQKKKTARKD